MRKHLFAAFFAFVALAPVAASAQASSDETAIRAAKCLGVKGDTANTFGEFFGPTSSQMYLFGTSSVAVSSSGCSPVTKIAEQSNLAIIGIAMLPGRSGHGSALVEFKLKDGSHAFAIP